MPNEPLMPNKPYTSEEFTAWKMWHLLEDDRAQATPPPPPKPK